MTKTMQAVRAGVLASAALLAMGAAPAQAAPQESGPGDWLLLTVTGGEALSSGTPGTLLLCDPPQGHPQAAQACDELRAAGGDISRIPPRPDALCPLIYAPVTASARGVWEGRRVDYTHTFPNSCVVRAETGAVFALSE
ncbi:MULTISPECIES: subtilase-type protease inhibitor [Streptomyces]|uniref:Serine protease n=1 Tax=Streptomyces dengpaensis TaxID=2049881 RepID=A0ABN5I2F1_9ACTN|nr:MULTISPECIES: subtilase-type protease inhibitor [Streptomyces]AVH55907.1 serine protease [Streptomyces dengpaensis]PIB12158.1 serine protease [Streptomyces sp. HG99]